MLELEKTNLNHYVIRSCLAHGGMSDIYLAHDEQGQTVAIKVVHKSQDDFFVRFQREVKALRDLTHEHVLPVLDCGEDGFWHYCVMPYIRTGTLRDRIRKGTFSMEEAGVILDQVASALQHAHDAGILHRDLKPSNILLTDNNHAYLADFGLAKGIEENSEVTQAGCLIGTPEYMAPELAECPATASSDIYALGIVLYQMLTGQVPFRGTSPLSIYWKHIQELPTPPSQLNPAISDPVEQVILCALEKDPARRFQSAQAMAEAYTRALQASSQTQVTSGLFVPFAPDRDTLPPPVQRVIPMSAVRTKRGIHPAFIALAAVLFLLILPLTLGFTTVYLSGKGMQAPAALGASAQFIKLNGLTPEVSPQPISTTTQKTTTTTTTVRPSIYLQGNTNRGGKGGNGNGGGGHGGHGGDGGGHGGHGGNGGGHGGHGGDSGGHGHGHRD